MAQVPFVIEKTANGERSMDIGSRLLQDRIIVLGEDVNEVTATLIIEQMLFLEHADPDREICFYIKSPGGSVSDGLAIYDTMQYIKCDVRTICMGMAASIPFSRRNKRRKDDSPKCGSYDSSAFRRDSGTGIRYADQRRTYFKTKKPIK